MVARLRATCDDREAMETPLTPLELMRRTRRLYPNHEAVVDGELRLTYEQFFARCDRWSAVLQRELGVPVKLVGLGEGPDDLAPFEADVFVDALLED